MSGDDDVPGGVGAGSGATDPAGRQVVSAAQARSEVEAQRAVRRAAREARLTEAFGGEVPGRPTIWATWIATTIQVVATVGALADEDRFLGTYLSVSLVLFGIGSALFVVDIVLAAARSTRDAMGIGGLFFCAGTAPRAVALSMNASLAVAVLVSLVAVGVRFSTPELAFGTLAPVLQLALTGFWGVRHGVFAERGDRGAAGPGAR
jgi:hypothetical protein